VKNFSLQTRIISGFLFVGLLVLVVAIIGWSGNARLSRNIYIINNNVLPSIVSLSKVYRAQTAIQSALRLQVTPNSDYLNIKKEELETVKANFMRVDEGFAEYKKLTVNTDEKNLYQSLLPLFEDWKSTIGDLIKLNEDLGKFNINDPLQTQIDLSTQNKGSSPEFAQASNAAQVQKRLIESLIANERPTFKKSEAALIQLIEYNEKLGNEEKNRAKQDIDQTSFFALIGMFIGPLTAIVFGIYFSNAIAKPLGAKINHVVRVAEQIAAGNLTIQVPNTESKEEIGKLQNAFRKMSKNLNLAISQVNQAGLKVTQSTTQIAAVSQKFEATVTEQSALTHEVKATSEEIALTSGELVQTMNNVSEKAQATATAVSHSQADLMQLSTAMRQLVAATKSIASKLGVIDEKANNINSVVTTITTVADMTNLLSLNAAIEAEKAGEYGVGFSVIAREIRRLADQTGVATLQIEKMVKEMQSSVSAGVGEMGEFNNHVSNYVQQVSRISEQIALEIQQVQSLMPDFEQVSGSMEKQFEGAQQINTAITQLSEASQQTVASLHETNLAVNQLDDAAQTLQEIISRFKV